MGRHIASGYQGSHVDISHTDTREVVSFSDSDYAGYMDDKKSTSSYIFMMAEGAVSWKSVNQTLTASSTMEVEYVCGML